MFTLPTWIPGPGGGRWIATWSAALGALALLWSLVEQSTRPPRPRAAGAPAEVAEDAVRGVARHLSEEIGLRVAGTAAADRAAADLVARLARSPRLEVELQDARDEYAAWGTVFDYRVRNVVARLPGRRPEAILLAAHYDSPPESVGAADNAVAVGVLVEVARALSAGDQLEHTVVFLLDGGEEAGLLGADGFLAHRWASAVRGFVNLDAAGLAGQAILFQAGPGDPWLAEAYARVPRPFGTIVGQDLFERGLIASDTDGRVFRGAGWSGLDLALFEGGYLYQTMRDRLDRVEPGSAQGLGDNVLALTRELAGGPLPPHQPGVGSPIYFDLFSRVMVVYSDRTALIAALAAAALLALGIVLGRRRHLLGLARCGVAAGLGLAGVVAGLAAAVGAGLVVGVVFAEPHGWFDQPALAILGFGGAALIGAWAPQAAWAARRARAGHSTEEGALAAFAGAGVVWSALALALALARIGSGYVATVAALGCAAGLLAAVWAPERLRKVPLAVGWAVGAVGAVGFGASVVRLFVPMVGRMYGSAPFDPLIAGVVALPVIACALAAGAVIHWAGRPGWTMLALAALGVTGVAASALGFPYGEAEPKRVVVEQLDLGGPASEVRLVSTDPIGIAELGLLARVARGGALVAVQDRLVAPPTGLPRPEVTVTAVAPAAIDPRGARRVRLRIAPGAYHQLSLDLPRDRIAGWSLASPVTAGRGERLVLSVVGAQTTGYELELVLGGTAPATLVLDQRHLGGTPATRAVLAALPDWCTGHATVTTRAHVTL